MSDCQVLDLSSHRFSRGVCTKCGNYGVDMVAVATFLTCEHDLGLDGTCTKCGASAESVSSPVFEKVAEEVFTKWYGRDRPDLAVVVVQETLGRMNLLDMSPKGQQALADELGEILPGVAFRDDPLQVGGAYVKGLLTRAYREALRMKERMEGRAPPRGKLGAVVSKRIVRIGGKKQ